MTKSNKFRAEDMTNLQLLEYIKKNITSTSKNVNESFSVLDRRFIKQLDMIGRHEMISRPELDLI